VDRCWAGLSGLALCEGNAGRPIHLQLIFTQLLLTVQRYATFECWPGQNPARSLGHGATLAPFLQYLSVTSIKVMDLVYTFNLIDNLQEA
jgi:hypothetical protein